MDILQTICKICSYQFNVHINHLSILLNRARQCLPLWATLRLLWSFLWRNSKIRIIIGVLVPEAFHQLQFRGLPRRVLCGIQSVTQELTSASRQTPVAGTFPAQLHLGWSHFALGRHVDKCGIGKKLHAC